MCRRESGAVLTLPRVPGPPDQRGDLDAPLRDDHVRAVVDLLDQVVNRRREVIGGHDDLTAVIFVVGLE
jgi:hypothetical protein